MIITITSIIYAILFMYNITLVKSYLEESNEEGKTNPVEYLLKNWPDMQYDGTNLTSEDPSPQYMVNAAGMKLAVIDTAGGLNKDQLQKVPLVFAKDKVILWINTKGKNSIEEPTSFVLTYDSIFGTEPAIINKDFVKGFLRNTLNQIGVLAFCISLPILIVARVIIHITSNLFSMVLLYFILWGMRKNPTISVVSRIVLFSSGAAEFITPFLLLLAPSLISFATFVEYWAVMLAMYAIGSQRRR